MSDEPSDLDPVHLEMGLKAFSVEPECPKCESKAIETVWHATPVFHNEPMHPCEWWMAIEILTGPVGEHLCRVCLTCRYGWPERTGDA